MVPELTDQSLLTFGKQFKGHKLANVPAWYLLWIYDNFDLQPNLKKYIDDNRQVLEQEKKRAAKEQRR